MNGNPMRVNSLSKNARRKKFDGNHNALYKLFVRQRPLHPWPYNRPESQLQLLLLRNGICS